MKKFLLLLSLSTLLFAACGGESQQAKNDYQLGMRLIKGVDVTQDQKQGMEILTRAADEGSAQAQLALGFFLMKGEGIAKDPAKGLFYFEQAAKSGNIDGQYNAGLVYVRGEAGAPDLQKAYHWFEAAALQGDPGSQFNLGVMLANGEGVTKDPFAAYAWFVLADRAGYAGAGAGMQSIKAQLSGDQGGRLLDAVTSLEKRVRKAPEAQRTGSPSSESGAGGVQEITVPL